MSKWLFQNLKKSLDNIYSFNKIVIFHNEKLYTLLFADALLLVTTIEEEKVKTKDKGQYTIPK